MARSKARGHVVTRDEARDLYLRIFDEFASEIGGEREQTIVDYLNGEFTSRKIDQQIVVSEVNGGDDGTFWQCWNTYDSISREQAEEMFDAAWATARPERRIKVSTTVPAAICRCGCRAAVTKGKGYLPGHDARHAGQVARRVLGGEPATIVGELPTEALRAKALAQVERGNAKAVVARASVVPNASRATSDSAGVTEGYITHLRERIPAQVFQASDGTRMNINNDEDGSGDWLDAEGYAGKTQAYWLKRFVAVSATAPAKAAPRKRAPRRPTGDGPEGLKDLLTF